VGQAQGPADERAEAGPADGTPNRVDGTLVEQRNFGTLTVPDTDE